MASKYRKEFVDYLKTLPPEEWERKVTDTWTIHDVVAHMIGWEKQDPGSILRSWEHSELPWWHGLDNYDSYNQEQVEYYKNFTPSALIAELEKWQREVEKTITLIGEEKLKSHPDAFNFLFDESPKSHYRHHLEQIQAKNP